MNIFSNFIPHKIVAAKTELKNRVYNEYIKNGQPEDLFYLLQNLTSKISSYISKCRNDYFIRFGKKLGDPSRSIKTHWAALRTLLNEKKVPNIIPLLVNNEIITKANIFNKYFASQCTTISNNSVLPSTLNHLTDDKLSPFNISSEVIFQLIKNLDPNKAHGLDEISVMLKLCALQYAKHLLFSLRTVLQMEHFLMFGKKVILFHPVHKKMDNQLMKNYRPVSVLPIYGKLMFNSIFKFIDTKNMLSVQKSGFCPGNS